MKKMKNRKQLTLALFFLLFSQLVVAQNVTELAVNISDNRLPAAGKVQVFDGSEMIEEANLVEGSVFFEIENITSVFSPIEKRPFISYPNPVTDGILNIVIDANQSKDAVIRFYDLKGSILGILDVNNHSQCIINEASGVVLFDYRDNAGNIYFNKVICRSPNLKVYLSEGRFPEGYRKSGLIDNTEEKNYTVRYLNSKGELTIQRELTLTVGQRHIENWDATTIYTKVYQKVKGEAGNADLVRNRVTNSSYLGGNANNTWFGGGGSFDKHLLVNFDEVILASPGDQIILTLNYRPGNGSNGLNQSNSTANSMRLGLYNTVGAKIASGIGDFHEEFKPYTGYYGAHSVKEANAPGIFRRQTGQTFLIQGDIGVNIGTGTQNGDMKSNEDRTLTLTITRTPEGNKIKYVQNGTGSFSFEKEDSNADNFKYNALVIGLDDTPELIDWFWIYDLYVEHNTNTHPVIYNVIVNNGTGDGAYTDGTTIQVEAQSAPAGKIFDKWTGDVEGLEDVNNPLTSYSLNGKDVNITATYKTASKYSLTVNGGDGSGSFNEQSIQKISAAKPAAGKVFDKWTGDTEALGNVMAANTDLVIPQKNIAVTATYKDGDGRIMLPVEVMGLPPHIEQVELDLGTNGSSAQKLFVQVHNNSYDNKGSIRVNGGNWIDMNNSNIAINMQSQAKAYGGFGGGFSTIKFTVDKQYVNFKDGLNSIEFRYNFQAAPTAGYRILNVNILNAQDDKLIADNVFYQDDPTTWEPPLNNATDIAAGETFFKSRDLGIGAKCMDCHTSTGIDFKYFNISNKTITEQVIKSGFTRKEGEQVASYIRSLNMPIVTQARVYNPPYQPGPGTDAKPVYEWAAGAGLEWVLESDEEMLSHIFGSGTRAEIDAVTDIKTDLNLREIPVAVMFPDWLRWIPQTHPMDIWGKDVWENGTSLLRSKKIASKAYLELRNTLDNVGVDNLVAQKKLISTVENFANNVMWWVGYENNTGHPWTATIAPVLDQRKPIYSAEYAKTNLATWLSMKLWEVMMEYELEDKAIQERPTAEKYNWPVNEFTMFVIPAHFTGDDRGTSHFAWESPEVGAYWSSVWYEVAITVNSGMREPIGVSPSDWAYNFMHIHRLGERTGIFEPLRQARNLIKCYQQRDQPESRGINKNTWIMRETSPWRAYSDHDGDQRTMEKMNEYQSGLRAKFTSSLYAEFIKKVNKFSLSQWPRSNDLGHNSDWWETLEYANYDPTDKENPGSGKGKLFAPDGTFNAIEAHAFYRLLDGRNGPNRLQQIGVDGEVIRGLAEWADMIWTNPNTDWFTWDK